MKLQKSKEDLDRILTARWPNAAWGSGELTGYVSEIVEDVKTRGDQAVLEYTERFDKVKLSSNGLKVTREEIDQAYDTVSEPQLEALKASIGRLTDVERRRLEGLEFNYYSRGVQIMSRARALQSCGCYVPGGKAVYPSSLVMNVVPAKVAGVERIVVATPPGSDGRVNPLTLVAADLCGVNDVYRVGGIQAVAALAYGTETIGRVDKITGPGNKYVTEAKNVVSGDVSIDKPAGPSEILIIADDSADPYLVALDMISQAEHGTGGISGLLTTSDRLAMEVESTLTGMMDDLPRSDTVAQVLGEGGFIYTCKSLDEAVEITIEFAPEHLEVQTLEPIKVADRVSTAGLILVGRYSPVSATDYCMGVNHVLPTEGYAKVNAGLSVLDYVKVVNIVDCSREGLNQIRDVIGVLSKTEGLPNHGLAVEGRFKE
jgi:histidinol dehydrogenase